MNPLLREAELPRFDQIDASHVVPAISAILEENQAEIDRHKMASTPEQAYRAFHEFERLEARLAEAWSPVSHLNAVVNNDELRAAYNACLPLISAYETAQGQDPALKSLFEVLKQNAGSLGLTLAEQKAVDNALRDFQLSGVDLDQPTRARFGALKQSLSAATSRYAENVLDATDAWYKQIETPDRLRGLPERAMALARQSAKDADMEGYRLTLSAPSYLAVMTHAEDRDLRREVYEAFVTRASDQGPQAGQFDNTALMQEILIDRQSLAEILDFERFTELSLARKMAPSPERVLEFLAELGSRTRPVALEDMRAIHAFARDTLDIETVEPWDLAFCAEGLKRQRFALSDEDIRPYFPATKVLKGLFEIVRRLFDVNIEQTTDVTVWHSDVTTYVIKRDDEVIARFYLDLYARAKKRGGAWMADCRCRRRHPLHGLTLPVAFLTCNFPAPLDSQDALLSHDEVVTLFHEFGHGLHHMLTQVDCLSVSGINGVAWDAVELPSQFLENWCWAKEALELISGHHLTGEPLPAALLDKMLAVKNYQSGMKMVRQLEFALFDFRLHNEFDGSSSVVQRVLDEVRESIGVTPNIPTNRFQNGFNHIFGDEMGYAAGYYSYKWAEVLSADAFSKFEAEGLFNRQTGEQFLSTILEHGGSQDAMALFKAFRGREPSVDALLKQEGIAS